MRENDKKRIDYLDLLRAVAILLMILSHTIFVFHDSSDKVLEVIKTFANTVAFTTFLFISAAVSYISYIKDDRSWPSKKKKLLGRTVLLLVSYYIVAFVGNLKDLDIVKILLFIKLAGYTEFIIAFILFSISIYLFRPAIKFLSKYYTAALLLSFVLFGMGMVISNINLGILNPYKNLIAGSHGIYSFPILQYSPIFMLGIVWGALIDKKTATKTHQQIALKVLSGLIPVLISFAFIYKYLEVDLFLRWPPQIGFLLAGVVFIFLLIFLLSTGLIEKSNSIFKKVLLYLSRRALPIYIYHTLIILIYGHYFDIRTQKGIIIFAIFCLITLSSTALTRVEELIKKWGEIFIQNTAHTNKK